MNLSEDSPVSNIMDTITDILLASFLWLLCSIPLITIGASSSALYYTIVKVIRRKQGTVARSFFGSFKENLLQGMAVMAIYLVFGSVIAVFILFLKNNQTDVFSGYIIFLSGFILAMPLMFSFTYIFAVISRFKAKLGKQIQYALYFSVGHIGTTLILFLWFLVICSLIYFFSFSLLILPGVYAYVSSVLIEKVFSKHMTKEREKYDGLGEIPWYFE